MGHFQADAFNSSTRSNPPALTDSTISASISTEQLKPDAALPGLNQIRAIAAVPSDRLRGLGNRLLTAISRTLSQLLPQSEQPQVRWWRDARGYGHYSVYDPVSRKTQVFDNAHQVRVWLEQRYYR